MREYYCLVPVTFCFLNQFLSPVVSSSRFVSPGQNIILRVPGGKRSKSEIFETVYSSSRFLFGVEHSHPEEDDSTSLGSNVPTHCGSAATYSFICSEMNAAWSERSSRLCRDSFFFSNILVNIVLSFQSSKKIRIVLRISVGL